MSRFLVEITHNQGDIFNGARWSRSRINTFTRPIPRAIEVVTMVTMTLRAGSLAVLLVGGLAAMPIVRSESTEAAAVMLEAAVQAQLVDGDLSRAIKLYARHYAITPPIA